MNNEQKRQKQLYDKVQKTEMSIRELNKQIKLYKRLNFHTSNRLVELETEAAFPEKIKTELEEQKFLTEKVSALESKLRAEE